MTVPKLHLASISPRRQEILTALGLTFSSAGVDLDDAVRASIPPHRRDRPEIGATDGEGRVSFRELLPHPYRVEISHSKYAVPSPRYVDPRKGGEHPATSRLKAISNFLTT